MNKPEKVNYIRFNDAGLDDIDKEVQAELCSIFSNHIAKQHKKYEITLKLEPYDKVLS